MVERDFAEQALEAGPLLRGPAAPTLVLVDDEDSFPGPTERGGVIG